MGVKLWGYGLAIIGLIGIAISTEKIINMIPFLSGTNPKYILIPGVILVGIGIILVMSTGSEKSKIGKEVPIYHGKNIVGYRVLK